MPGWIDTSREDGVVAHIHLLDLAVVGNDSATALLTGMELHALWVVLLIVVTVDTLTLLLKTTQHIVVDDALIIVFQTTLTDGERLVTDERRMNQSVTQPTVDTIGRNEDAEGFIVCPLVSLLGIDINGDLATSGLLNERAPIVSIGLGLPLADDLRIPSGEAGDHIIGKGVEFES